MSSGRSRRPSLSFWLHQLCTVLMGFLYTTTNLDIAGIAPFGRTRRRNSVRLYLSSRTDFPTLLIIQKYKELNSINSIHIFRENSDTFASAARDGSVHVWDCRLAPENGAVQKWTAHDAKLNAVQGGLDGVSLLTSGRDDSLRLWDRRYTSAPIRIYSHHKVWSGHYRSCSGDESALDTEILTSPIFCVSL